MQKKGDPFCTDLRRVTMFGASEPFDPRDATTVAAPPPKRHSGGRGSNGAKRVNVEQTAEDVKDWSAVLARIRDERDEAAFVELFNHFAPRLKAFLMRSGADAALAEECVQEVMATVWQKSAQFDPSRASVATWVFTIARNRRIDVLRRQKRPEPEDLPWGPEAEPDQEDQVSLQQETEHLGEALASLPAKQRELIEKAYFGDLTHSEIAEATGLPLGTIKSRIRLALQRLRHAMDRV
nr:sigma-70 family RNA polymerase sigma factor [Mameliella sediminis]